MLIKPDMLPEDLQDGIRAAREAWVPGTREKPGEERPRLAHASGL